MAITMDFLISARTDIGIVKNTNQDSLSVKIIDTPQGKMAFAILCDGMGGLSKGEVASAAVIRAFDHWILTELPDLCKSPIKDDVLREQWEGIVTNQNEIIKKYGAQQGIHLGTTVVAMLLTESRYYVLNVGDSRAYEITDSVRQITLDQTYVAREIALGRMTPEEAKTDPMRNVLLQCIGASDEVQPDLFCGDTAKDAVYLLCSDGFRHVISPEEIYEKINPSTMTGASAMGKNARYLIELNKQRQERDNISVAMIRTV